MPNPGQVTSWRDECRYATEEEMFQNIKSGAWGRDCFKIWYNYNINKAFKDGYNDSPM